MSPPSTVRRRRTVRRARTVRGRSRALHRPRSALPPWISAALPALAAGLVAIAGAVVLWQGLERTDALGGDAALTGRLPVVTAPVVVTVPGLTDLSGDRFTVRAGARDGQGVFVGVGRSDDVEAYLGGVARAEVTALASDGTLRVAARAGDPSLPDPAGVDVWADQARGAGTVSLTWPQVPGSWRVVVAVDGRTPVSSVQFSWTGRSGSSSGPALIAVGAVLLVCGLAGVAAIRSGRVFAASPTPADAERPADSPETAPIQPFRRRDARSEDDS